MRHSPEEHGGPFLIKGHRQTVFHFQTDEDIGCPLSTNRGATRGRAVCEDGQRTPFLGGPSGVYPKARRGPV